MLILEEGLLSAEVGGCWRLMAHGYCVSCREKGDSCGSGGSLWLRLVVSWWSWVKTVTMVVSLHSVLSSCFHEEMKIAKDN